MMTIFNQQLMFRFILLISILTCVSCKLGNPFVHIPISGPTTIDNQERKFIFDKPFEPIKQVNEICFEYVDNLKVDSIPKPPVFPDGKPLIITSYLVDQNDKKYDLSEITRNRENYLCLTPDNYDEWLGISKQDVAFVQLFVRSNRKLDLLKIEWKSYNAWDMK
jgi:hypothetical protein